MFRRIRHFAFFMLCMFAVLPGCSFGDDKESGSCKFNVISYGNGFAGYYIIDGESPKSFSCSTPDGNGMYSYTLQFETPTSIMIYTYGLSDTTTSLIVMLYKNKELLDSISDDNDDGSGGTIAPTCTFNHTFTPDEEK
jgi:hypothetical protein